MVAPLTPVRWENVGGTAADQWDTNPRFALRDGYTQPRPHNVFSPYEARRGNVTARKTYLSSGTALANTGARWAAAAGLDFGWLCPSATHLRNRAYARFVSKLGDQAELGVSIAELGQSAEMIEKRVKQLLRFTQQIRKRQFVEAAYTLGYTRTARGFSYFGKGSLNPKRIRKDLASAWLEYWLGWAPAVGDIYNAINVLQSDVPISPVKASVQDGIVTRVEDSAYVNSPNAPSGAWTFRQMERSRTTIGARVVVGANVKVANHNLWLANQLGLVNPATVALELVPFSFVAEWFWNLRDVVSSFTDFYGLSLTDEYTVEVAKGSVKYTDFGTSRWFNGNPWPGQWVTYTARDYDIRGTFSYHRRVAGLPRPVLYVRPFQLPGWQRIATASSLLSVGVDELWKWGRRG